MAGPLRPAGSTPKGSAPQRRGPAPKGAPTARAGSRWLACLAAVIGLSGCPGEDRPLALELRFAPTPPVVGENRVVVQVEDPAGSPIADADVHLAAVQGPEGRSGPEVELVHQDEGRYAVGEFAFPDPGEWTVEIRVTLADGERHTVRRTVTVSGAPVR